MYPAGIQHRNRRMGQARSVQDDPRGTFAGFLQPVDEFSLRVRLAEVGLEAEGSGLGGNQLCNLGKAGTAIDLRLPGTQEIEVRPVQDIYRRGAIFLAFPGQAGSKGSESGAVIPALRARENHMTGIRNPVRIRLNGEDREFAAPLDVRGLLFQLGLEPTKIAVERNLEIVPRSQYGATALADGDRLEIVQFIGGG